MLVSQAAQAAAQSLSSLQVVIFVFSAIIVAFWRVILRVLIAILVAAMIASVLYAVFMIASITHR